MKAALIGYGYWGSIIERYILAHEIDLKYIYCLNNIDHDKQINNLDTILEDSTVSMIFVCTPIHTHFDICKAALESGKHVFCEKPAVKNIAQLRELVSLAEQKKRIMYTDYLYAVSPSIRYIKQNIHTIGRVQDIYASIEQFGNFYSGDDVYEVLAVHMMSAIYYIMGKHAEKCKFVDGFSAQLPLTGKVEYKLENGCSVNIHCSLLSNTKIRKIQFFGENGSIEFSLNTQPNVIVSLWRQMGNSVKKTKIEENKFDETQGLYHAIEDFKRVIKYGDGRRNMDISMEVQTMLSERVGEIYCEKDK